MELPENLAHKLSLETPEPVAMHPFRKNRVAELIREVISDIIRFKIKDPRVQGVTVTEVLMAGDLKSARVYFGSLADGKGELHLRGLEAAEGFLRREIGRELDLKYVPTLSFFYDTSFDNFARIDSILKELQETKSEDDSDDRPHSED